MALIIIIVYIIVIYFACTWVSELCNYRVGAENYRAVFFTIFFTPIAGLLYVLCHQPITEENDDTN